LFTKKGKLFFLYDHISNSTLALPLWSSQLEWSQGDPTKEYGGWIASVKGSSKDL
jgi:hypothetical protein